MKISLQKIYKALFYLLIFINLFFKSIELSLIFGALILFLLLVHPPIKYSLTIVKIVFSLILILIISIFSGVLYSADLYNILKDFGFLFKPILFLLSGYLIINKIEDKNFLFKALIYAAFISAIWHLIGLFFFLINTPFSVTRVRGELGRDNFIELFALALLSVKQTKVFFSSFILRRIKWIRWILIISFVFYFSRTMFISVLLIILAVKGYTKISSKGLLYFSIFSFLIISFLTLLQFFDLNRESEGVEGFFYKIKQAPSEIFQPDLNINIKNHENLWDHWRAYEALKAIDGINSSKYNLGWIFGKGLGAQVDLGFEAPLDGKKFRYIPIIHNGYIFILFKSGILGLTIYLWFLFYIYSQSYKIQLNKKEIFINNLISGIGIFFILTSLIITGIYNKGDVLVFFLGGLFSLQCIYSKNQKKNENRRIRN